MLLRCMMVVCAMFLFYSGDLSAAGKGSCKYLPIKLIGSSKVLKSKRDAKVRCTLVCAMQGMKYQKGQYKSKKCKCC